MAEVCGGSVVCLTNGAFFSTYPPPGGTSILCVCVNGYVNAKLDVSQGSFDSRLG